jgi:hypothetical protein
VEDRVGGGRERDAEVDRDERRAVEADRGEQAAEHPLAVVDQVEPGTDEDDHHYQRGERTVDRKSE